LETSGPASGADAWPRRSRWVGENLETFRPSTLLGGRLDVLGAAPTQDALLDAFLAYVAEKKLELYTAQEEAILAALAGQNVILNTPTGSGKSLVATALHFFTTAFR